MHGVPSSLLERLDADRAREYNFQKQCAEIAVHVPFSRDEVASTAKILQDLNHPDVFAETYRLCQLAVASGYHPSRLASAQDKHIQL